MDENLEEAGPHWLRPAWLFLLLGLVGALPLVVLTPPFQLPDEAQHFARAYQISEGTLWGVTEGTALGAILPSSIPELVERFLGTRAIYIDRSISPRPLRQTLHELDRPLQPERRGFVDFTGSAHYAPLAYLPQASAIAAGRWVGAGPLGLLYLGRLANALVGVAVMAWAIALLPRGRHAALILGLLPMPLCLYASVSPDVAVIASVTLFSAIMLRGAVSLKWNGFDFVVATVSGLIFCSLKPVYAPLLGLGLPAVMRRERRSAAGIGYALMIGIILIGTIAWLVAISSLLQQWKSGSSVAAQLQFSQDNPGHVVIAMIAATFVQAQAFAVNIIGTLGWGWTGSALLPSIAYVIPALAFVLCANSPSMNRPALSVTDIIWTLLLVVGSYILILLAMWLSWTPVGYKMVAGVLGRYFLPSLGAASVVLGSMTRPPRRWFLTVTLACWWLTLAWAPGDGVMLGLAVIIVPGWLWLIARIGPRLSSQGARSMIVGTLILIEIGVLYFGIARTFDLFS